MMYSNKFAAAIKVNGKVLREIGDTVYLPFGSEYEIRLKNMDSRRAKVFVEIDGQDVTEGGLVLKAFQTIDLERFLQRCDLETGNRFRFIERSSKIEEHRGIKVEDGLIQIRYEFEKPLTPTVIPDSFWLDAPRSHSSVQTNHVNSVCGSALTDAWGAIGRDSLPVAMNTSSGRFTAKSIGAPLNESGITVKGSQSNQKFTTTHWRGTDGQVYSMVLKLLGETEDNRAIREPLTVNRKIDCETCGTSNPASAKFCKECGTALRVFSSVV